MRAPPFPVHAQSWGDAELYEFGASVGGSLSNLLVVRVVLAKLLALALQALWQLMVLSGGCQFI